MTIGIWVLGNQLWQQQAALASCSHHRQTTPVLLLESHQLARERRYHKQKLILVWSAMRHFAQELEIAGWPVTYAQATETAPALKQWIQTHQISELRLMDPVDHSFLAWLQGLEMPCQLTLLENNHFLWSTADFKAWAADRKTLLMESFYRSGRRRFKVLMAGPKPVGGEWNFDRDNRKPPGRNQRSPQLQEFQPNTLTQAVIDQVDHLPYPTFGQSTPFPWAVTRLQAQKALENFIADRLESFGPYQDAMVTGQDSLWHALISPYLNLGLLHPWEVIEQIETAYHQANLPINSVEGFIRQVLGWREYMRGIYSYGSSDYGQQNWFNHHHPLPEFFWTGQVEMHCLQQVINQIHRTGYAHHIQRLMILSNFALIAGFRPQAVEDWFHAVFIDAYDWVMQPNVIGMGLFADGGWLASKPYAASANYINRMSDYCQHCPFNPKARTGPDACPFNFFYWDFLLRHRDQLKSQGRMGLVLKNLDRIDSIEAAAINAKALEWYELQGIKPPD